MAKQLRSSPQTTKAIRSNAQTKRYPPRFLWEAEAKHEIQSTQRENKRLHFLHRLFVVDQKDRGVILAVRAKE